MGMIRYKKRGNKFYVYEVINYWDKERKTNRQKSTYLGNADEHGGPYAKTGRKAGAARQEKAILDFGDSFAIHQIAGQEGLTDVIEKSFPGSLESIMNLLCYQIAQGSAMSSVEDWTQGNIARLLFKGAKTKSQDISRLIENLGRQDLQQNFFKNYVTKFFPKTTALLIDSTSLPSAINASINAFGHTGQGIQENVTCLMLVDKASKLPIYFRAVGGDIADTSTLKTTIEEAGKLGLKTGSAILDAGYCSKENLEYMGKKNVDFVTRLPRSHNIFYELIDTFGPLQDHAHCAKYGERVVFISSEDGEIYGQKMFAHIILDPAKRAKDMRSMSNSLGEKMTNAEIEKMNFKIKYAGFLVLLSKSSIAKNDILPTYYTRQAIEQIFGFAKSNNNLLPLRVHSEQSINGYLMLVFLCLIVFIKMREKLQPDIPMDKALIRLRSLKAKVYDDQIIIQEPNKKVKDIATALNITMPTSLGV